MKEGHADRRIQRTREALHRALVELIVEKAFETITVQEIAERANVGRSTFYLHFRDTEDLLLGGFEHLWSLLQRHLEGEAGQRASVWSLSLLLFRHAQHYTTVYKAVVGSEAGHLMLAQMHKRLSVVIRTTLADQWVNKQIPLDIVVHHLAHALVSLLTWWIEQNLPYTPEQVNRIFEQLTRPAIEAL